MFLRLIKASDFCNVVEIYELFFLNFKGSCTLLEIGGVDYRLQFRRFIHFRGGFVIDEFLFMYK